MLRSCVSSALMIGLLSACGGGSGSGGTSSAASPSNAAGAPVTTLFGVPADTKIDVVSHSASLNRGTGNVRSYTQDFWFKSRSETDAGGDIRRIRYGRPFPTYHPHHNYTIPITVSNSSGQAVGTGSATFTGSDVETGVTSRTITLTDIQLSDSIFGIFSTEDTGSRGDVFEIHAYAAGSAATGTLADATYTGTFVGDAITNSTSTAQRINLPVDLTVNFGAGTLTGTIGAVATPDINLDGTITGTSMSGTATVATTNVVVPNGSVGTFNGAFFGVDAVNASGTVGISDKINPNTSELVGAFGTIKN